MLAGILSGITWAVETIILGMALDMAPFVSTEQAIALAPFVSTFLHDAFSALWVSAYNAARGKIPDLVSTLRARSGKFVILAAIISGPVGMTGYVLSVNNLGPSIGAVASSIYPAIGSVLAYLFLKEEMQWYRWVFLVLSLLGVYGLSYSPNLDIANFWLGLAGTLMCAFGWGVGGVIIAKCIRDDAVPDEIVLQIRQITSALAYGVVLLPVLGGWDFTCSLFSGTGPLIPTIAVAALSATASYLFYYRAMAQIGAAKSMALNISYSAWAVVISIVFLRDTSLLNPVTILCTAAVLVCGILAAADYRELLGRK